MIYHGTYRLDGTFVGFDYERQAWVDTEPFYPRDMTAPKGSARNPFCFVATTDTVIASFEFLATVASVKSGNQ